MANLIMAYGAAAFGICEGHFEAAYVASDNERVGMDVFSKNEIEEPIRKRVTDGPHAVQSATTDVEGMKDVAGGLSAAFNKA